jgi:hypothetical protein
MNNIYLYSINLLGVIFSLALVTVLFKRARKVPGTTGIPFRHYIILLATCSILLILFTYFNGMLGFKFDEHYVALGGYYISNGLVPHIDFYIPNGAFIYYLQGLGNLLFSDLQLAYSFSASLIGVLSFIWIIRSIRKHLHAGTSEMVAVFLIFFFTFFSISGCLWYNQLSVILLTICIMIVHAVVIDKKLPGAFHLFLLHILPFLSFITKVDSAVISLFIMVSSLILYTRHWKVAISVVLTTVVLILCYIYIYQVVYKVNILDSMNIGQDGFDKRIGLNFYYLKKVGKDIFFSIDNLGVRIIVLIHFILLVKIKKWSFYRLDYFSYVQCLLFIAAGIITVTSGRGAGFINSHFATISFITLLYFIRINEINIKKFDVYYITAPLILIFVLVYIKDFIPSFKLSKRNSSLYFVSEPTKNYFNALERLLDSYDHKVVVFSWVKYFAINNKVSLKHPTRYLWEDLGTTVNRHDQKKVEDYFIQNKPDVLIVNSILGTSFFYRFFENPSEMIRFVNQNYTLYYSGKMDIIGSGGGNSFHDMFIYKLK